MSIPFSKYIRIISGVGGGAAVRQRDLIGRIITSSPLVSPDTVLEFSGADDVGTFFGTTSEEAKRAARYFGYVSPSIASPRRLGFGRWSKTGNASQVIGNNDPKVLNTVKGITAGSFSVTLAGGTPVVVAGVNLAAAASLTAAAALVQTALQAASPSTAAATVSYGVAGTQRFAVNMPAGTLGTIDINSVTTGAQDLAVIFGLTPEVNGLNITGVAAQTALDAFANTIAVSNNFGSTLFQDVLSPSEAGTVAAYNGALNIQYMYLPRTTATDAATTAAAVAGNAGTGLTLYSSGLPDEFPEQLPMAIMAATDYSKRNSVQNYMFKQIAGLTPLVLSGTQSDTYDALRVNYYGRTETAGQLLDFYQRGVLMGGTTAPVDMNVYANEAWLKDYAGAELMALQLAVSRIPANNTGRAMILNTLQPIIDQALFNGVISVGKTLTSAQKVFVSQQTGDDLAWHAVQDLGYILSCTIETYVTSSGTTEYKAVYVLIYSKDDAIRRIEGTHALI